MLTHPKSTYVRAILDPFKVWLPISPERIKRSTIGNKLEWSPPLPRPTKKNGEVWSTIKKVIDADVDLLNSTMRILHMLMHLSSGHVILLPWVFHSPPFKLSLNRTYGAGRPHVGLCPIFLVSTVFSTSFFFLCSVQDIFHLRRQMHISNALILSCHSFAVPMSHFMLYAIQMFWLFVFFQLETERSTHEIFFLIESFLCQCNATSYFTFASAVLGHHTSKVAELCDWLQFFTVDHYSQLPALPPWHLHNFSLFFTFIRMLYFCDVCCRASVMRWSPHWVYKRP